MEFRFQDGDETRVVRVTARGEEYEVCVGERRFRVRGRRVDDTTLDLWIDGAFRRVRHAAQGTQQWIAWEGATHAAERLRHRRKRRGSGGGSGSLAATMPGQIVAVLVQPGQAVERGQTLLLMEAMKMELKVAAPQAGTVARLLVAPGDAVERGQTLVEMEGA